MWRHTTLYRHGAIMAALVGACVVVDSCSRVGICVALEKEVPVDQDAGKDLALHCRFSHFTSLTLSAALLVALASATPGPMANALEEAKQARRIRDEWPQLRENLEKHLESLQPESKLIQIRWTELVEGKPTAFLIYLDINDLWFPLHRHLIGEAGQIPHSRTWSGGRKLGDFVERWDWGADLSWVYTVTGVRAPVLLESIDIGGSRTNPDRLINADVQVVASGSIQAADAKAERAVHGHTKLGRRLYAGELPTDMPVQSGVGSITIRGAASTKPEKQTREKVRDRIHLRCVCNFDKNWLREEDAWKLAGEDDRLVRSVSLLLPTAGDQRFLTPLKTYVESLGLPYVIGETFAERFPSLADLPEAYHTLEWAQLIGVLEHQSAGEDDREVEVFGLRLPFLPIAQYGLMILAGMYGYFTLHLSRLESLLNSDPDNKGWDAAWVAIYKDDVSKAVSVFSVVLFPMAAAGVYAWQVLGSAGFVAWCVSIVSLVSVVACCRANYLAITRI